MLEINKIYNEDCIGENGMCLITDKSIDIILCDLPYGTTQCKWDTTIPLPPLWEQYNRIIKKNGVIVLTSAQPFTTKLIASNINNFKYSWVWEKSKATGFLNSKIRPLIAHEDILIFSNSKPRYYPQMSDGEAYNKGVRKKQTKDDVYGSFDQVEVKSSGLRYPRSVVYFKTAESEGKTIHKTQKPVELFEYLIKTYSNENDVVLDNCIGAGTTAIASINTNRNYIGFELDKTYFDLANERIEYTMKER